MPEADSKDLLVKMLKRSINAIKPISEHHHAPPPEMSTIIETMMKVDLKSRYQTMDAVVQDLEAYQASAAGGPGKPATPKVVTRRGAEPEFDADAAFMARGTEPQAETAAPPPVQSQAPARDILCIEAQDSVREAFQKALTGMGYRVQLAGDAEGAARKIREARPDALLYDADGLGPMAIEVFLQLQKRARKDGREPAALVLVSPKHAGFSAKLPEGDRLKVLAKPLKMKDIQEALKAILPIG